MIDLSIFEGRTVAVLGLGRTGLSAAAALMRSRAQVWAWDDDAAARDAGARSGIPLVDLTRCDWSTPNAMVLSPGIPHTHPRAHPAVALARDAGCAIIGDIELLVRTQRGATFIGVTGTNGKSTTTALLGHILKAAGRPTQVGGNIGVPVLELQPSAPGGIFVPNGVSDAHCICSVAVDGSSQTIVIRRLHKGRLQWRPDYFGNKRCQAKYPPLLPLSTLAISGAK